MATTNDTFYTVEVSSRFAAFLDDPLSEEDPNLLLSKIQNKRAEEKREKLQQSKEKKAQIPKADGQVPPQKVEPVVAQEEPIIQKSPILDADVNEEAVSQPQAFTPRGRARGRTPFRGFYRGPRDSRPPRVQNEGEETEPTEQRPQNFNPRGFRPRGRGTFNPRNPRYRGNARFNNERPFEKAEESEPLPNPDFPTGVQQEDVPADNVELGQENRPANVAPAQPEEPVGYTLEEYRAMRSANAGVQLEQKVVRAPNDGKNVFANMVPRTKIVHPSEGNDEGVHAPKTHEVDQSSINFTFNDRRGGRPFERSRGGFRGGNRGGTRGPQRGGRGFARGAPAYTAPPPINDDQEFPSLSK